MQAEVEAVALAEEAKQKALDEEIKKNVAAAKAAAKDKASASAASEVSEKAKVVNHDMTNGDRAAQLIVCLH